MNFLLFFASVPLCSYLCRRRREVLELHMHSSKSNVNGNPPLPSFTTIPLTIIIDIGSSSIKCTCTCSNESDAKTFKLKSANSKREWTLRSVPIEDFNLVHGFIKVLIIESLHLFGKQMEHNRDNYHDHLDHFVFKIISIGFTSFGMTLVGINSIGKCVLHLSYQGVTSNPDFTQFCGDIARVYQGNIKTHHFYRQLLGTSYLHPSYALCQLLYYLKQSKISKEAKSSTKTDENNYGQLAWSSLVSFVINCLFFAESNETPTSSSGETKNTFYNVVSPSEASWCGVFDYFNMRWCKQLLLDEGAYLSHDSIERAFPPVVAPEDMQCPQVPGDFSIPELRDAKIYQGLVDGAAASIGSLLCSLKTLKNLYMGLNNRSDNYSDVVCIETEDSSKRIHCSCKYSLSVTIGTSSAVRFVTHINTYRKIYDDALSVESNSRSNLFRYRINKDFLVVGGALTDGGSIVSWWKNTIAGGDSDALLSEFNDLIIRNKGLDFAAFCRDRKNLIPVILPFFSGERNPGWNLNSQGHMLGLDIASTKFDILVGIALGIITQLRRIQETIFGLDLFNGVRITDDNRNVGTNSSNSSKSNITNASTCVPLVASGGALETSPGWRQLLADMLGSPVILNKRSDMELTTLGVLRHIEYINCNKSSSSAGQDLYGEGALRKDSPSQLIVKDISLPRDIPSLQEFLGQYRDKVDIYYSKLLE